VSWVGVHRDRTAELGARRQILDRFHRAPIGGQLVMNVLTHTHGHPHYYNGTFAAYAVLMWIGLDTLIKRWPRAVAIGWTQAASCAALCILLLAQIIRTGGTRGPHFGATLANQVAIVRELANYSELSSVAFDVNIQPRSLQVIESLIARPRNGNEPVGSLVIRYADSANRTDGHIALTHD